MKRNNHFIEIIILLNKIEINNLFNKYLLYSPQLKMRSL